MQPTVAWLGVDARARFSMLAWMDDQGNRRQHWRFPASEPQLIKHLKQVPATTRHLALEECGLAPLAGQVAAPHGVLKTLSYRAWLAAMKHKRGAVHEFYAASLARTGDEVHARLNTRNDVLASSPRLLRGFENGSWK